MFELRRYCMMLGFIVRAVFYGVLSRRLSKWSGLEESVTPLYGGICAMQVNVVWATMDNYGGGRSGPLRRGCGMS